jgi:hypothetical protein
MTAAPPAAAAGNASGRPADLGEQEPREHSAKSMLSWAAGARAKQVKEDCVVFTGCPDRPVRFDDPVRNAAYWARIDHIVAAAPPLSQEQRAVIRTAFSQTRAREAA